MAGYAKTSQFMLSSATVMIGPMAKLHQLNPTEHSIGLVKNFALTADPTFVELTQGVSNAVVMSVKNNEGIRASMELYEYSARNIGYAAGLDASGVSFDTNSDMYALSTATSGGGTSVVVGTDASSTIKSGDYIFIQNGIDDIVHIAKAGTVNFASSNTTITLATGYELPTGANGIYPVGSRVGRVKRVDVGGPVGLPQLGAKIVGVLPKDNAPFTILMPKIRVTKGMGVAFNSDNFGNLPFEFTPYAGIPGDPLYTEYGVASAILFPR